jgi:hypothetical protein
MYYGIHRGEMHVLWLDVTTLTLGLRRRKGLAKMQAKCEGRESHFMLPKEWEGMNPTLPSELPLWELESRWISESSKSDWRRQNPLDWKVPYIIENILERKCLKWARMTHLDT